MNTDFGWGNLAAKERSAEGKIKIMITIEIWADGGWQEDFEDRKMRSSKIIGRGQRAAFSLGFRQPGATVGISEICQELIRRLCLNMSIAKEFAWLING
jgi:hypothetical protein